MPDPHAPSAPSAPDCFHKTPGSAVKVSVAMITYNHEKYIAQAIESVLMQETDFEYEIVIGEDASTDGTRDIVRNYHKKHPDKIRILLHDRNIGANANTIQTRSACAGRYIAYLEGDDYWIDKRKLQKQAAFLDQHPAFSMCYTGAQKIDENGRLILDNMVPHKYRKRQSQEDLVAGFAPPALTVMARRVPLIFPQFSLALVNLDYFEYAMITEYGPAGYLADITACYRIHSGGIWSMKDEEYITRHGLELAEALLKHFGRKYKAMLLSKVRWYYGSLIRLYLRQRRYGKLLFPCLRLFRFLIVYELTYRISETRDLTMRH